MKKYKKVLTAAFLMALILCLSCQTAFAFSESDAQAQVDAAGREAVSGNVLVWFLCAIAFLKVSQKDRFAGWLSAREKELKSISDF